ncbi:uncharacterized protein LOC124917948 [Impatiens glandulifera]|uniref:uncharacterized protein LOC124917948 n=1 Tax=Impatiens glandulifera TaxID=253017 RepID=UPI001FB0CDDB|nr:uncharacterized protein LOC124917948 [Impatiens glandulifera]
MPIFLSLAHLSSEDKDEAVVTAISSHLPQGTNSRSYPFSIKSTNLAPSSYPCKSHASGLIQRERTFAKEDCRKASRSPQKMNSVEEDKLNSAEVKIPRYKLYIELGII